MRKGWKAFVLSVAMICMALVPASAQHAIEKQFQQWLSSDLWPEARARGIRAMLPHVDDFRTLHNLAAMEELCAALAEPARRTHDPRRWLAAA